MINAIGYAILVWVVVVLLGAYFGHWVAVEEKMSRQKMNEWADVIMPITLFFAFLLALAILLIMWR